MTEYELTNEWRNLCALHFSAPAELKAEVEQGRQLSCPVWYWYWLAAHSVHAETLAIWYFGW